MKKLKLKEIKERHTNNPKDKILHTEIENKEVSKEAFNKLIKESTQHEPFDKQR